MERGNRSRAKTVTTRLTTFLFALLLIVAGGPAASATAATDEPAAIQGQVLADFDPIGYATVTVFDAHTGKALKSVTTNGEGDYRVNGLPAVQIKVRASMQGWLASYANGKYSLATADVFALHAGQTLTQSWDPVVLLLDMTYGAEIHGLVTGVSDDPNAPRDGPLPGATVKVFDADGTALGSATSNALGTYRIDLLPPGQVRVRASKTGWLPASTDLTLPVWGSQRVPDLTLRAEAVIQGQVLGWMDPVGYAKVTVLNAKTGKAIRSTITDGSGYYRIGGLRAGQIKVVATKPGWLAGYADGVNSWTAATVYTLVAGQTLTQSWDPMVLYLDMTPEAVVAGQVTGVNDGPLPGVTVTVFNARTGRTMGSATTDSQGEYRIGQLAAVSVKIRFSKPGWQTVWVRGVLQAGQTFEASPSMSAAAVIHVRDQVRRTSSR